MHGQGDPLGGDAMEEFAFPIVSARRRHSSEVMDEHAVLIQAVSFIAAPVVNPAKCPERSFSLRAGHCAGIIEGAEFQTEPGFGGP
jgi:hypothetical protein